MRAGWTSSLFLTVPLRVLQLLVSAASLGLSAWLAHRWGYQDGSQLYYTLALSAISVAYLLGLPAFSVLGAGNLFTCEFMLFVMWLAAFILTTHSYNECARNESGNTFPDRCKVGHASIGTSAVLMVLFDVSYALCLHNVVVPICYNIGPGHLWRPFSSFDAHLSWGTALSVSRGSATHSPV